MASFKSTRGRADAQFEATRKRSQDAQTAQFQTDAQAQRKKTDRLKSLRLAKEASDLAAAPAKKKAGTKATRSA